MFYEDYRPGYAGLVDRYGDDAFERFARSEGWIHESEVVLPCTEEVQRVLNAVYVTGDIEEFIDALDCLRAEYDLPEMGKPVLFN